MPLFEKIKLKNAQIVIWKIEEEESFFRSNTTLSEADQLKLTHISHPKKRLEFLALRQCLRLCNQGNLDVFYTKNGKPFLNNKEASISFSHNGDYAAVIFSKQLNVGIDIESFRPKIKKLKNRFLRNEEAHCISSSNEIEHVTAFWSAKETVLKINGNKQLDFKENIKVSPFLFCYHASIPAYIQQKNLIQSFNLFLKKYPDFLLSYGWSKD